MQFKLFSTLGPLSLASASPLSKPRADGPTLSTSKAFTLSIQGDLNKLDPAGQSWTFASNRYGSGQYTAVARTEQDGIPNPVYYLNSTENTPMKLVSDIPGFAPLQVYIADRNMFDPWYPGEHPVSLVVAPGGTESLFSYLLHDGGETLPVLGGPTVGGWGVCPRTFIFPGGPGDILAIRWFYGDEALPEDCVPVNIVLECAELAELPEGSPWNHDSVREVQCLA